MQEGAMEFTMEELREFLEGDLLDARADPEFKERLRRQLAAFLQNDLGLSKGDRVAIMMPNLLQNAVRHAGRGAGVEMALRAAGQGLVLEITDNGPGLEAVELAGLLQGGRPGRGLAFSRELARASGAELEIETAPGQGLAARVLFPAARCLNAV